MQERLQKIISRAGIASRRAGEEIILAGRVRVNGHVITELGAKADLYVDNIEVDGRRLIPEAARYLVLHKPRGVVSTLSDPEGRPTVAGLLEGAGTRLYPVGRLDFATSGVLLVTNDGDFAHGLLHPRGGVPKTYVVKTKGTMTQDDMERWRTGVELEDGRTLPAEVDFLRHEEGKTWFEITLREGRNQQIRRMGEATRFPVMRLARTSFAGITSEGLRPGQWRPLTVDEMLDLRTQYGVPKRVRSPAPLPDASARRKPRTEDRPAPRAPGQRSASPRSPGHEGGSRPQARDHEAGARPRTRARDEGARPHARARDEGSRPEVPRSPGQRPSAPRGASTPRPATQRAPAPRKPPRRETRH